MCAAEARRRDFNYVWRRNESISSESFKADTLVASEFHCKVSTKAARAQVQAPIRDIEKSALNFHGPVSETD